MRKIYLLMFAILFISLASATTWGTYKQDKCVNLITICPLTGCNATTIQAITYPNSTIAVSDVSATHSGTVWNYTFCNTHDMGTYTVYGYSTNSTQNESFIGDFEINYRGEKISSSQAIVYFILLIVIIFVFIMTILGIERLPKSNEKDEEGKILSITYLKYLRPVGWFFLWMFFIAILFLSSNLAFAYLSGQLFAKILFNLYRICFGLTPLIVVVWIIWIYRQMFHDKQFQKMLNRGIFPQGRLP